MRRLAVLDLDGTLTPDTLGALLAREVLARGGCAARDRQEPLEGLGGAMAGTAVSGIEQAAEEVWARVRNRLFPFVRPFVRALEREGFLVALVSGAPIEMVTLVATDLGIDVFRGAVMEIRRNRYTGRLIDSPALHGGKPRILRELASLHHVCLARSFAMGNASSDAEVFELVGMPAVFEPREDLARLASERGWCVVDRTDALRVLPPLLAGDASAEDTRASGR